MAKTCQFQGPQRVKRGLIISGASKLQKGDIFGTGNLQFLFHSGVRGFTFKIYVCFLILQREMFDTSFIYIVHLFLVIPSTKIIQFQFA